MILGLILAAMTAAAIGAVIWPFVRRAETARSGTDVAVYRDQLDEVERDLAAGLIGKTEGQAARVEISRRLLAAAAAADAAQAARPVSDGASRAATQATARRRGAVAVASLLALPIVAGGLYLRLGSPELAAQPAPGAPASVERLVGQVEAHLQRNPDDGRAWEVLAPVYMRLQRYADSVNAWRNTLRLLGESAERDADLGEALTAEADGVVTADAKAAFLQAAKLDSTLVTARYYLGLAAAQDGDREKAAKIWRDLIAQAPAGAPWVGTVRQALASVEAAPAPARRLELGDVRNALAGAEGTSASPPSPPPTTPTPPTPASGPGAAQMQAAADQPPDQQDAMIRGMVERLAARLKQDGSDVEGWVQLVRSYNVLGEPEKAQAAAADARQALAGDPGKLQRLNAALKDLEASKAEAPAAPVPAPAPGAAPPEHPQGATIQDMVERLAARLKKSGSDPAGWLMLARSYLTLGEKDKATAAISDARQALAAEPEKLQEFNDALKQYGVGE